MQLTRAQLLAVSAAVTAASAGAFALGMTSAPDEPPPLPRVAAERVQPKPVGEGIVVPPKARFPR